MGKEWHWAGRSSKRNGVAGAEAAETNPSGCMCAMFQFFDFHPFHFPTLNQQPQQTSFKSPTSYITQDNTTIPKGAEAPRNSLESVDGAVSSPSKEEKFKFPKSIQIKTSVRTGANNAENLNDLPSPGVKTPTLVARLMGLDLLPGLNSPSSSSSSCLSTPNTQGNVIKHLHHLKHNQHIKITKPRNSTEYSGDHIAATRSLPETPRISSARRSDVDHHRLSLQIIKESLGEDLELPRLSLSKRKCDENSSRSPRNLARQIVKQVVSRKVGQDITNTLKSRRDQELVTQLRIKKPSKSSLTKTIDESSPGKHSNPSCSPRLRFMETKHKPSTTTTSPALTPKDQSTHQIELPRVLTKPKNQAFSEQQEFLNQKLSVLKCKVTSEKFSSRLKRPPQTSDIIRNKQEGPTSPTRANEIKNTKSKRTHPMPSNLLNNINSVSNLLPVKREPSPPATKIPQKQISVTQESKVHSSSQLSSSSCARQRYKQEGTSTLATRETSTSNNEVKPYGASTTEAQNHNPEFEYITQILSHKTIKEATTTTKLHPLDPSIFHDMENQCDDKDRNFTAKNELGHRWNRRLMFDLVGEVLEEILRPKKRLCFCHRGMSLGDLTESVWQRVEEFPRARCEVLEDIDALIEAEDMEKVKVKLEEGEELVAEIEGNIWDTLVHETTVMVVVVGRAHRTDDD